MTQDQEQELVDAIVLVIEAAVMLQIEADPRSFWGGRASVLNSRIDRLDAIMNDCGLPKPTRITA